ncbi:hypothetical protein LTR17_020250 [Elasticomyces elasticus]|nr:hypothetical protein LTR17_020250 [Elasticomyces elasticus]
MATTTATDEVDRLQASHEQATIHLAHTKNVLAAAIQKRSNITVGLDAEKAHINAMQLHASWWHQAEIVEAHDKFNTAKADQAAATQDVRNAMEYSRSAEQKLDALSRQLQEAMVYQSATDSQTEARRAEEVARRVADARLVEARRLEEERRQAEMAARRLEEQRQHESKKRRHEAEARRSTEAQARQDQKWRDECRQAEFEWRKAEYNQRQQTKQQNKRQRPMEEVSSARQAPQMRITREKVVQWHKACEALREGDKSGLRSFPELPYEACSKEGCTATEKTRALTACRCNITRCFHGRTKATLKVDRIAFHPDKDDVRDRIQQAAKEVFSVVQEMYSNA